MESESSAVSWNVRRRHRQVQVVNNVENGSPSNTIRCTSGEIASEWTSWTSRNPGRRFLGCRNYQVETLNCNFFRWLDPELDIQCYKSKLYELHRNLLRSQHEAEVNAEEARRNGNQVRVCRELLKKTKKQLWLMRVCGLVFVMVVLCLLIW